MKPRSQLLCFLQGWRPSRAKKPPPSPAQSPNRPLGPSSSSCKEKASFLKEKEGLGCPGNPSFSGCCATIPPPRRGRGAGPVAVETSVRAGRARVASTAALSCRSNAVGGKQAACLLCGLGHPQTRPQGAQVPREPGRPPPRILWGRDPGNAASPKPGRPREKPTCPPAGRGAAVRWPSGAGAAAHARLAQRQALLGRRVGARGRPQPEV